jgi:HEAT repeat protein
MGRPEEQVETASAKLRASDPHVQNEGVSESIALGGAAVPELIALLDLSDDDARGQAMFALSEIADARARNVFRRGLHDGDERVRSYAARGLGRLADPGALAAFVQTLNDAPDSLHADMTPSVEGLGRLGLAAVPSVLDLLLNPDELVRLRGQRALELIVSRRHGFRTGEGFPSPAAEEEMRAEWNANGNYRYDAASEEREASVAKWRSWAAQVTE